MRLRAALLVAALALVGCSAAPGERTPEPPVTSTAEPTSAPVETPTTRSPSPSPSPSPTFTGPLALVVHHSRPGSDVSLPVAEALLEEGSGQWSALGQAGAAVMVVDAAPAEAVTQVAADPAVIAVVPVDVVDERVRVLTVDGIDPLLAPADYPLRAVVPTELSPSITTLTVVGDIMLGRRVGQGIVDDPAAPFRPFAEQLAAADVTVGNFESTLSRNGSPTQGGDSFAADPAVLAGLELAGFDAVSLANNHLGDFGDLAMHETFAAFESAGIAYFGGGPNLDAARAPWIVEHDGVDIGFIGTESIGETPAAGPDNPGTNRLNMPPRTGPLDTEALERIVGDITALAAEVDTVIVLPHWGTQYTHVPEPIQHAVAARFAQAGADLVLGGHPHWVQGWEVIGDTTVVHSLGNFIFDMDFNREVQEGVFVEIVLWDGAVKAVEPVPYVIDDHFPRPATDEEGAKIIADLRSTSTGPYAG